MFSFIRLTVSFATVKLQKFIVWNILIIENRELFFPSSKIAGIRTRVKRKTNISKIYIFYHSQIQSQTRMLMMLLPCKCVRKMWKMTVITFTPTPWHRVCSWRNAQNMWINFPFTMLFSKRITCEWQMVWCVYDTWLNHRILDEWNVLFIIWSTRSHSFACIACYMYCRYIDIILCRFTVKQLSS